MIAQEGSSPEQMQAYQSKVEKILHANPAVKMTVTVTGSRPFLASNQGFILAILKDPDQRPPIQQVAGQLMGGINDSCAGSVSIASA